MNTKQEVQWVIATDIPKLGSVVSFLVCHTLCAAVSRTVLWFCDSAEQQHALWFVLSWPGMFWAQHQKALYQHHLRTGMAVRLLKICCNDFIHRGWGWQWEKWEHWKWFAEEIFTFQRMLSLCLSFLPPAVVFRGVFAVLVQSWDVRRKHALKHWDTNICTETNRNRGEA